MNKFGTPLTLLSDQGRNFEAKLLADFCSKHNIRKIRTTAYHPQTNGLTERTIRTIKQMLSVKVNKDHNDWDILLNGVTFAYNNTTHDSTGYAPNEVVFGKLMHTSMDRKYNIEHQERKAEQMVSKIDDKLEKSQAIQKVRYDKTASLRDEFKKGDFVVIANTRQVVGQVRSFQPKFLGPYVILRPTSEVNFEIRDLSNSKVMVVHYNRLAKYNPRDKNVHENKTSSSNSRSRENSFIIDDVVSTRQLALIACIKKRREQKQVELVDNEDKREINEQKNRDEEIPRLADPFEDEVDDEIEPRQEEKYEQLVDENKLNQIQNEQQLDDDNELDDEEEEDKFKCDVEGCEFVTAKENGLAIHKGRVHKQ